ncbi:SCP-like protein [Ancylostoma ceylanicum]|uniref:SCP-like protein n=1 Tax=Ancylostoma ceylanicum TaxID=53326 RepID=A0A0D6LNS8_9BILA|nr:SCP-like protein [Ancylostoma ceylanicum]
MPTVLMLFLSLRRETFGCKNELISDAWRDMVLTLHNDFRRKLAQGTVQGQAARLPVGKNIKQLYWDCALEKDAQEEAVKCPSAAPTVGTYGIAFEHGKGNAGDLYSSGGADATQLCADCANDCEAGLCNVAPAALLPIDTMCQTNQNSKTLMTDDLRNQALNMHNYYRRVLASGWAKDAKLTYAKPSKAMPALTVMPLRVYTEYDCALEETIMTHIKDCAGTPATTNKAENFLAVDDYKSPREDVLQKESFRYDTSNIFAGR